MIHLKSSIVNAVLNLIEAESEPLFQDLAEAMDERTRQLIILQLRFQLRRHIESTQICSSTNRAIDASLVLLACQMIRSARSAPPTIDIN